MKTNSRHVTSGMASAFRWVAKQRPVLSLVLALIGLVQATAHAEPVPLSDLPLPVKEMRDMILAAVRSGNIEDLRTALEWNEMPPDLGPGAQGDQIETLKKQSGDGAGVEVLSALAEILDMPPLAVPLGKDIENNRIYVWPYLAETPFDKLKPAEVVDLMRLVRPDDAKGMGQKKKWLWWRLAIGADGTWQSFRKETE